MITADEVEAAIDWLRDKASVAAKARADRVYMEAWVKTALAQEMQKQPTGSTAAQERDARCSVGYLSALQALKEAVEADEKYRFLRAAAEARIEAYRTFEATRRAEGQAYSQPTGRRANDHRPF